MLKLKLTAKVQKLVVDTNVFISSILGRSYPHRIVFDLVFANRVLLFVSKDILTEYQGVLSRLKFQQKVGFKAASEELLESIRETSITIVLGFSLNLLQDESDNKFLELALSCQADFLITGNSKHFPMGKFENTEIISPEKYWNTYWK